MPTFQKLKSGLLESHQHRKAYAAVVIEGAYEEAGDAGHFHLTTGDVVLHHDFEMHLDRVPGTLVRVLNLEFDWLPLENAGVWTASESLDTVVSLAERDKDAAATLLLRTARKKECPAKDWPSLLATKLRSDTRCNLSRWAEAHQLKTWTVSRGFRQVFGMTAERYRARARSHQALAMIRASERPFSSIAFQLGFADQAHMSRSIRQLTSDNPVHWRRLQIDSRPKLGARRIEKE